MSSTRSQLRVNGTVAESVVDGPGIRYVIFTQGCPHHCEGCHNPQTHDFDGGSMVDTGVFLSEIDQDPLLRGVTFSGGEPFCQAGALSALADEAHARGLDVMTYTGYTYEALWARAQVEPDVMALLCATDTLVDGPFILARRDLTLRFRGSDNQRVLRLKDGKIVGQLE
ncbi:MAG: anaerobic ribonucleoside-triphosphate reductase activating protein [Clostridia bacterium]|nr:anaerobic ribonucleoside-triphosphate reductase activating protein [Clostridia bacterium]